MVVGGAALQVERMRDACGDGDGGGDGDGVDVYVSYHMSLQYKSTPAAHSLTSNLPSQSAAPAL